jgi:hypothetical protein
MAVLIPSWRPWERRRGPPAGFPADPRRARAGLVMISARGLPRIFGGGLDLRRRQRPQALEIGLRVAGIAGVMIERLQLLDAAHQVLEAPHEARLGADEHALQLRGGDRLLADLVELAGDHLLGLRRVLARLEVDDDVEHARVLRARVVHADALGAALLQHQRAVQAAPAVRAEHRRDDVELEVRVGEHRRAVPRVVDAVRRAKRSSTSLRTVAVSSGMLDLLVLRLGQLRERAEPLGHQLPWRRPAGSRRPASGSRCSARTTAKEPLTSSTTAASRSSWRPIVR